MNRHRCLIRGGLALGIALLIFAPGLRAQNLFVSAASPQHLIYQFTPGGIRSTFATVAERGTPMGLAFDQAGNLFVAFRGNSIVKITPDGVVTPFATLPEPDDPGDMVIDSNGNLYVAHLGGTMISRIMPSGEISTFANDPALGGITGLALDSSGNLFAALSGSNAIAKITPLGVVTRFATDVVFHYPSDVALDDSNNLYVANYLDGSITRITSAGVAQEFSNAGAPGLTSLAFDASGQLYATNQLSGDIRKFTPDGRNSTVFASGLFLPLFIAAAPPPVPSQRSVNFSALSLGPETPAGEAQLCVAGSVVTLQAVETRFLAYSYQWRRNGVQITGATESSYTIQSFSAADAGIYEVVATAPDGAVLTRAIGTLVLDSARLVNLSARAVAGTGEDTMIVGFVLNGTPSTESPDVLVRSIGPTLIGMGVNGTLADPAIRVVDRSASLVAENDNWSTMLTTRRGLAATAADMAHFGAFALSSGSRDSAVLVHETPAGPYTALVSAVSGGTGIVLNEIYGPTSGAQRLVNLSARARVTNGDSILIAGFVITGNQPLKLLIRGVGPTLSGQGIAQPLNNPVINLYNVAGQMIHNNDNWGQAANVADIRTAGTATGAFPLSEGSHDAAMLETLSPGVYTVHVTSADGTSGVALVEIYEAP